MNLTTDLKIIDQVATITLTGEIATNTAAIFQETLEQTAKQAIRKLILDLENLSYMSSAGLRVLVFAKQKMGSQVDIDITGASETIVSTLRTVGFHHSVNII